MRLADFRFELGRAVGHAANENAIVEAQKVVDDFAAELTYRKERGEVAPDEAFVYGVELARHGLEILQYVIPGLQRVADGCLQTAGGDAVRTVCAPGKKEGTNHEGNPFPPIPSRYSLPPEFQTVTDRVKAALTGNRK